MGNGYKKLVGIKMMKTLGNWRKGLLFCESEVEKIKESIVKQDKEIELHCMNINHGKALP